MTVVIPVYHDTPKLERCLLSLFEAGTPPPSAVVVVNGDGADRSLDTLVGRYPQVHWLETSPGRGIQMNHGASVATTPWLLFLHADTRLDTRWQQTLAELATRPDVVGGAFRLAIDSPRLVARLIERGVAWRVRWLQLPYGDQAFFVRRDVFERLGGYAALPIMEDADFIRRLGRAGRLVFPAVPVVVSARRWERDGWLRRTVSNVTIALLYFLGFSPAGLARWYYRRPG